MSSSLINIVDTTEEGEIVSMDEPGLRNRSQQANGRPDRPAMEDERLLDHHIEEVLGALQDAAGLPESGSETHESQPD